MNNQNLFNIIEYLFDQTPTEDEMSEIMAAVDKDRIFPFTPELREALLLFAKWLDEDTLTSLIGEPEYYVEQFLNDFLDAAAELQKSPFTPELRERFFRECTDKVHKVDFFTLLPDEVWSWFEKNLTIKI